MLSEYGGYFGGAGCFGFNIQVVEIVKGFESK
jgi:hypothetical protein